MHRRGNHLCGKSHGIYKKILEIISEFSKIIQDQYAKNQLYFCI
jgi:hypothetical protein